LLYSFTFHPFPPTSLPSSLTSSYHLLFGVSVSLVASRFIHSTFLGILFYSILCICPNQRNLHNHIVSFIVGFLTILPVLAHFGRSTLGFRESKCFFRGSETDLERM
jgi:hypothetical protein